MKYNRNLLSQAIHNTLGAGAVLSMALASGVAFAQDEADDEARGEFGDFGGVAAKTMSVILPTKELPFPGSSLVYALISPSLRPLSSSGGTRHTRTLLVSRSGITCAVAKYSPSELLGIHRHLTMPSSNPSVSRPPPPFHRSAALLRSAVPPTVSSVFAGLVASQRGRAPAAATAKGGRGSVPPRPPRGCRARLLITTTQR